MVVTKVQMSDEQVALYERALERDGEEAGQPAPDEPRPATDGAAEATPAH